MKSPAAGLAAGLFSGPLTLACGARLGKQGFGAGEKLPLSSSSTLKRLQKVSVWGGTWAKQTEWLNSEIMY
ncbi:hypothetical protein LRS06_00910 [Hymenobacter sp. J193]|uniref:hypothetical protein n=1 Tax=Hymenobacter sp. J193 TaxID=2898429 RepID=UPI00215118B3|nr:hypothetical protein [Hymenobacter sp. J193]MCR5886353.1 hypothetical protein [Hymenobacter sp. J193]